MGVIYKLTSPSGRIYIGKSKNLKKRIKDYKYQCETRKSIVHDSIRGYGWDAHKLEIIEECGNEKLSEREIFWIKELNSYWQGNPKGMNMTRGGEAGGGSWIHDLERRKKQSDRSKGERGNFYGRKHTDENKKIIGDKIRKINIESGRNVPKWGTEKGQQVLRKPVVVYNSLGEFIGEFISISETAKILKLNIGSVKDSVLYGSWINGEYLVKYRTFDLPLKIEVGEIKVKTEKRAVLTLTPEYDVVCEHPSAKEASEFWGIPKTTINRAAMYNWLTPIRAGHVFIYTDLYEEILKAAS